MKEINVSIKCLYGCAMSTQKELCCSTQKNNHVVILEHCVIIFASIGHPRVVMKMADADQDCDNDTDSEILAAWVSCTNCNGFISAVYA